MTSRPSVNGSALRTRRPAWLPTLAAFVAIALFIVAGNWQHRRMVEKDAMQARMMAAAAIAPVALPASGADWMSWRYRQVRVTGVYDAAHQILIDNRVQEGRVGFAVVTPLDLDDGRVVLVERGWVPAGPSRRQLPSAPPPSGTNAVTGRIDIPPARYFELGGGGAPAGAVWQHLDPARFAKATGIDVLPIVVTALGRDDDGLVRESALPDVDAERNLSYMLQWYTFAALAAGLWAWFTVRPLLRLRRGHG